MEFTSVILIAALAVLLLLSSLFSASETAYTSFNRVRMKSLAGGGSKKAQAALSLAENYDKLLSAVLIGNNIVNILSTSLATVLFVGFFGNLGVTLSTVTMTLLVLLFGEVAPKALAKESPESFAMFATGFLRVTMVILTPLIWLMTGWQRLIRRLFKSQRDTSITEQELLTYVGEARAEGGINAQEEGMIRSVIEFDDLEAGDILTPRVDIEGVELADSVGEIAALFHETGYSRLPVYRENIDHIIGILLEKDFHYYVEKLYQTVEKTARPTIYVPKTVRITTLLTEMQRQKVHMAIVVDEYGGTLGLVTIEDILEKLVGDIWDEHDEVRRELIQTGAGSYHIYGGADIGTLFGKFDIQEETEAKTVGGWVAERLARIPAEGDVLCAHGLRLTVTDVQRNRVESLRIEELSGQEEGAE